MSDRIAKVNSLIAEEMGKLITRNVDLKPGALVTITKVDASRDLRNVVVYISVFPATNVDYVMKTLSHEHTELQKQLHQLLHMKILPKVRFQYDDTEECADVVEKLLRNI